MTKYTLIVCFFFTLTAAATAAPDPEGELWYDHAHGLVMQLPAGAIRANDPIDEALIRITSPKSQGDYSIHAIVKDNTHHKTIAQLTDQSIAEVAITSVDPKGLQKKYMKLGGRSAAIIYIRHADRNQQVIERVFKNSKQHPWIMGQALILLPSLENPDANRIPSERLLVIQMEVDEPFAQQGKAAFESMLTSLQIDDPKALSLTRMEQVNAAAEWLETQKFEQWEKSCIPNQLFGIQKEGVDIGYLRIRQTPGTELKYRGLHIVVEAHVIENNRTVDTQLKAFWSEDDQHEFWSKVISERSTTPGTPGTPGTSKTKKKQHLRGTTWTETGLRQNNEITVVRYGPAGSKTYNWQTPPNGYLSQVQVHLLGQMFKSAPKKEMGFYAYFSSSNSISYRTERIEKDESDGYRVLSRPNLKKEQFVTNYTKNGLTQLQQLPNGTVLIAMTKAQLAARWQYKAH